MNNLSHLVRAAAGSARQTCGGGGFLGELMTQQMVTTTQQAAARIGGTATTRALQSAPDAADKALIYPRGMVEIREYTLKPEGVAAYAKLAVEFADTRKALLPLLG
jgi:hypothetical protein